MTTHYMEEAEHCNRIAIIDQGKIVALDTPDALKRMVGVDIVTLRTPDNAQAAEEIRTRYGIQTLSEDGRLRLEVANGAEFIPRLVSDLATVDSVDLRRPTLDDVFLKLTGRAIRDAEAGAVDRLRLQGRIWRRGGRRS